MEILLIVLLVLWVLPAARIFVPMAVTAVGHLIAGFVYVSACVMLSPILLPLMAYSAIAERYGKRNVNNILAAIVIPTAIVLIAVQYSNGYFQ